MATGGYRLTAALAFVLVAGTTAAGWHGSHPPGHAVSGSARSPHTARATGRAAATKSPSPSPSTGTGTSSDAAATQSPTLSPKARGSCPAAASACVDLTDHLTWLQSGRGITYGPVSLEPGPPGTRNATPRGIFHVQWKAGPNYISTEFDEPMPWAVFFAPGGVAFHAGSLTQWSHGCVHLTLADAHYYNEHLPVGAEVVVF